MRFSRMLRDCADRHDEPRIAISQMIEAFGRRGQGALMVVLGAPNILPLPLPGLSMLSGIPLFVIALQIVLGRNEPWLPAPLARRSLATADFRRVTARLEPWLQRVERVVVPRLPAVTETGRRALGLVAAILALALVLPLPFGNGLPGLALALLGLALMERDGLLALGSLVVAALGLAVTTLATGAILGAAFVGLRAYFF